MYHLSSSVKLGPTEMLVQKILLLCDGRHHAGKAGYLQLVLLVLACWCCCESSLVASEPYEKFLARMREEQLFDLALVYLEDIEKRPDLDKEFKEVIDLERALLYSQAASFLPRSSPQRVERLSQTEASLQRFVMQHPKHARRSEARMKLGGLLQMRAEEALVRSGTDGQQEVPEAIQFFDQAHQLFESIITELAEREASLRGGRTDTSDSKQVAERDRITVELRESELLSAKAVENRGRSRGISNPQRVADLQQARKMFSDLYTKEKSLIAIRYYALFYRSGIYQTLGQADDAIDGYLRIVDLEGIEALRPLQTEAVTELAKVLASQGKYEVAIERAQKWLNALRTDEKTSNDAILLSLEYARIRIEFIQKQRSAEPGNRNASRDAREVRDFLRGMLRTAGTYQDRVKSLLGQLGFESGESPQASEKLPTLKNLAEAINESQKRMDDADALYSSVEAMEQRLASGQLLPQESQELESQKLEVQQQVDRLREQALALIRTGLGLYNSRSDERSELFKARRQLASLLLLMNRSREAVIVGEFLSRTSPATPQGLTAARIVLGGYSKLIKQEMAEPLSLLSELAPFAEFLVANWPQSAEATTVSGALTQLAILSEDWDGAERYLQILPEGDPSIAAHYFDLGAALFDQHQRMLKDDLADPKELASLGDRAIQWLQMAAKQADSQDLSLQLGVSNALALLMLSKDRVDQAQQVLITGERAPMRWLAEKSDSVTQDSAMDACRTAMKIVASSLAVKVVSAKDAAEAMQQYVVLLQQQASRTEDGQRKLQGIFTSIARDLKEKLTLINDPTQRNQLSDVVLLVMKEASQSESFATQYWAASSMLSIAEELESKAAYEMTSELLLRMTQAAARQPGWAQPQGIELQLKVLLAKAAEGAEDYRTALQTYGQILDENENLLDVQLSVARTLQKVGIGNTTRLTSAIQGARPHPQSGNNVFWGWGKISQMTSRRLDDYSEQFFESRFQLANCRWMMAMALSEPTAKNAELVRAERALTETHTLYPALGGSDTFQLYETLLKKIQKELGKPPSGFRGSRNPAN